MLTTVFYNPDYLYFADVIPNIPPGYKDWNNYTLMEAEKRQAGPGEQGQAYNLPVKFKSEKDQLYKVNGFNARASDDIALNRSLHDLRHPK